MSASPVWSKSGSGGDGGASGAGGSATSSAIDADYYRRLLDRLFSMLSHDLRTPLSAISGWLFLLESDKLDAAGRKRALDKMRSNLDDEVRMIDDALALARVKAGTLKLEAAAVDVAAVIRAAAEAMLKPAGVKRVALRYVTDPDAAPIFVTGDAGRLQRAIELIVDHALRCAAAADAQVSISATERESSVQIVVEDNGRGIAADAVPWLTDPFGSPPDRETGNRHSPDRGLLVAAALIDAQGGRLQVTSAGDGEGAMATITFPRAA